MIFLMMISHWLYKQQQQQQQREISSPIGRRLENCSIDSSANDIQCEPASLLVASSWQVNKLEAADISVITVQSDCSNYYQ